MQGNVALASQQDEICQTCLAKSRTESWIQKETRSRTNLLVVAVTTPVRANTAQNLSLPRRPRPREKTWMLRKVETRTTGVSLALAVATISPSERKVKGAGEGAPQRSKIGSHTEAGRAAETRCDERHEKVAARHADRPSFCHPSHLEVACPRLFTTRTLAHASEVSLVHTVPVSLSC